MFHILHIDQSQEFNQFITNTLGQFANLSWAPDLSSARRYINETKIDMILLDIILPDGDGIEFCYSLQNTHRNTPVIVLTGQNDISKKVLSFAAGADDYITRPFHKIELQAKVDSKLKKNSYKTKIRETFHWKEIQINKLKQEIIVKDGHRDRKTELTAMEFKILILFAKFSGVVLSRDMILNRIWGNEVFVSPRSVDTHISKLRRKLSPISHIIQSIHGSGYMFCPTSITQNQFEEVAL
jgi:DNA-binding response OmpR family regulator